MDRWKRRRRIGALAGLVLAGLLLGGPGAPGWGAAPDPAANRSAGSPGAPTLREYQDIKEEASAAWDTPQMDKRIARCESFLREHPDSPEVNWVRGSLIDACLQTKSCPPGRVVHLLEEQARSYQEKEFGASLIVGLLKGFYLKHDLPLDSAQKLVGQARASLAAERRNVEKEQNPMRRRDRRERIAYGQPAIDLAEGRILLAHGDAAGALPLLKQAEAGMRSNGRAGVLLTDGRGQTVASLPRGDLEADWLYLSLADAAARTGDRAAARRYLDRVRLYTRSYPEQVALGARLRRELGVAPPATREFRSEPVPVPPVTFHDLKGKPVSLAQFRGQVLMLMLWTTW